jgi:molybdopterin-guanine dinucleotide biosynthesis protein A
MGVDKALLEIGGEPLVARAARLLSEVADPVVLAPGTVGRLRRDFGYLEIADDRPGAGPLGGLAAALAASPHPLVAAVAVDMPFASPAVFGLLASLHDGEDAIVPVTASGLEPLHAVYSTACLDSVRIALEAKRFGLSSWLRSVAVREVLEAEWRPADPDGRFPLNVNRVEDLELLTVKGTPGGAPLAAAEDVRRRAP